MNLAEILQQEEEPLRKKLEPLLASCPADAPVSRISLPGGRALLREGDSCGRVYLLLRGRVSVIISRPRFSSYTVSEFAPPEFFGEYELLAGKSTYLAEVRTAAPCRFLAFPAQSYLEWVRGDPDFFFGRVRNILSTLLDQTVNERTCHFLDASGRVIQVLLRSYEARPEFKPEIRLNLTRAEIAERTGCSVRTVNRVIRELAGKQLLTVLCGKIRLSAFQYRALRSEFDSRLL